MIAYEKIIRDIQKVTSWNDYLHIRDYFHNHMEDYTEDQADGIATAIETKLAYFDPEDCSILSGIELIDDRHVIIHQDEAQSLCADAHNADMTLPDFLLSVHPSFKDFKLQERQVSAYEKRLAKEIFGVAKPERATPVEREEGVLRLEVDRSGLLDEIQRLRSEFSEEAEDLRTVFEKEIRELNSQIIKLRSGEPIAKEELEKPYVKGELMDSLEFGLLVKLMARRGAKPLLLKVNRSGRNDYNVTLQGKEQDVSELLDEVSTKAQEERKKRSKNAGNLISTQPVEKQYPVACAAYTQATGRACNRYVGWVAEQIVKVMKEEYGEHYDEQLIDWTTIDWTLGSKGPMTAEKASEIFSAWLVSHNRENNGSGTHAETNREIATEFELLAEYLALVDLRKQYGKTDEETLIASWKTLEKYGYAPGNLPMYMQEANRYFLQEMYSSLQDEIDRIKQKYKLRLGIEDGGAENA